MQRAGLYYDLIAENFDLNTPEIPGNTASPILWMQDLLDPEIPIQQLQSWFQSQAPVYLISNSRKENELKSFLAEHQIDWSGDGLVLKTQQHPLIQMAIDKGYCRVQDKGTAYSLNNLDLKGNIWDCCAGAGGKSLRIAELGSDVALYSSDLRENSIRNLLDRFKTLGMIAPKTAAINVNSQNSELVFNDQKIGSEYFDIIVADVPCSGSGTWRHTPEDAHLFKPEALPNTLSLQQNIVKNILPFLKKNGHLIYITCSVFDAENKQNIAFFEREYSLNLVNSTYTGGADLDCDYIFRAVLRK